VQDLVELVDVVPALKEGAATEEFGQDTANRPDVDWEGGRENELDKSLSQVVEVLTVKASSM